MVLYITTALNFSQKKKPYTLHGFVPLLQYARDSVYTKHDVYSTVVRHYYSYVLLVRVQSATRRLESSVGIGVSDAK